jgi:DNA-binding MarR family transcriptional regulator
LLAEGNQFDPMTTTAAVEDLIRSLYQLGLVHREIARHALAELGSQGFTALAVIARYGPLRIGDVAERLSIDVSVASRQAAALEQSGYVVREHDEHDRRARRVSVTETGTRVLKESHRRMVEAFSTAMATWEDDEVLALARGLDRLRADFRHTVAPQKEAAV